LPGPRDCEPERLDHLADLAALAELGYRVPLAVVSVPRSDTSDGFPGAGAREDRWSALGPEPESEVRRTAEETVIFFDWDDTLCPSTVCIEDFGLGAAERAPEGELAEELREYALHAKALIKQARMVAAEVAIVTNAGEGWVMSSCSTWLPELASELSAVKIVSARAAWEPYGLSSPTDWKEYAFRDIVGGFYSKCEDQLWRNIVAIGDAPYEHEALKRVVLDGPCAECCRSKSIRFLVRPSIEVLRRQIDALLLNLEHIVAYDGNLDLQYPAQTEEEYEDLGASE